MSNERKTERGKLFGVLTPIILQLEKMGGLILLKMKEPGRKTKTKIPTNVYFKVSGFDNLVWMHVQSGYGVFINHYVISEDGKIINLVDQLSKCYWYICNTTNEVKSAGAKNTYIYRQIGSVIQYGDINKKLPKDLEVHHKMWKFCHIQEVICCVSHDDHMDFHDNEGTRASHQQGKLICSLTDMMTALDELIKDINEKTNSPM